MNNAIKTMLARYQCVNTQDYINALKEIIQEVTLLGLWRAKFYEHAAFYGGTALRIMYQLDRFSEDLDFSLLNPDADFSLTKYNNAIVDELSSFGFAATVEQKIKSVDTAIQSAFIKTQTQQQLLAIETPTNLTSKIPKQQSIKIKMEVDTDPPGHFRTQANYLLLPIPFSVNTYQLPDLFAGKLHALICRQWKNRVKGRDWYDLVWYVSRNTPCHLKHLQERLVQSGHWKTNEQLTLDDIQQLLIKKLQVIDIEQAKNDIAVFIDNSDRLDVWSYDFFESVIQQMISTE